MIRFCVKGDDAMNANEFITLYLNANEESRHRFEELLKELEEQPVSLEKEH